MITQSDEEIEALILKDYGKGYKVKIREIDRSKKGLILVFYKVTAERDGCTEWRVKGWSSAMSGWDYPYRRKF